MTNRRDVLKGVPWCATLLLSSSTSEAESSQTLEEECEAQAQKLADCLAQIHGGQWRVEVNHSARFVLVVPCHSLG